MKQINKISFFVFFSFKNKLEAKTPYNEVIFKNIHPNAEYLSEVTITKVN